MAKQKGEKIRIETVGGEAEVIEQLGSGGQGAVYRVRFAGKDYALKWYHKPQSEAFYNNLKDNIARGAPNSNFLWPQFLTKKDADGCFGYLMDLRRPEYKDFGSFLLAKTKFSNTAAMIEAAVNICVSFRELHNRGYSYQDLNDGNFFINPQNGDVLICDNDNVAPPDVNTGILGKCRYMAPEIVTGANRPNTQSDRFSLAVILFLLFFNNHPLDGKMIVECPLLTENLEKEFYGTRPVFIYDRDNDSNRPLQTINQNVVRKWLLFPEYVRESFINQFSNTLLHNPQQRQTEKEWLTNCILRLRHDLVVCPNCGNENFVNPETGKFDCGGCNNTFAPPIIVSGNFRVTVSKGKFVYEYVSRQDSENWNVKTGEIVESRRTPGLFGLKNLTCDVWQLTKRDGTTQPIATDQFAPLLNGNQVNFGNGTTAKIEQYV
jgi:DNA-binding helix-hairpin-helix protein with protein kinase domain